MAAAIQVTIDGKTLVAQACSGKEGVNAHFALKLNVLSDGTMKAADLVGKPASVQLTASSDDTLTIHGIVKSARAIYDQVGREVELEIGPALELFTQGQDSAVFLDQTAADIAGKVLAAAGFTKGTDFAWTATTPPSRPYTAQYREAQFAFVDRLAREEGAYWFYDHGDSASKLTIADDSTSASDLPGATFRHQKNWGTTSSDRWIGKVAAKTVTTTNKFTTADRDPLKPALALTANASAAKGDLEIYSWPAKSIVAGDITTTANRALDALRARKTIVSASTMSLGVVPGKILTVDDDGSPLPDDLKKLFILSTDWTMENNGTFTCRFEAIAKTIPFRAAWEPRKRAALGAETAFVRGQSGQEITVDENGSVWTQPPWDRSTTKDSSASKAIRVGQVALARSMAIPRIGWTQLLAHYDADIDRGWVERRLIDGQNPPPFKFPDNMTQTSWQTLTSTKDGTLSEIVFEDKTGSEQITVQAAKDMKVTINDNEARTIGNRHVLEVDGDRSVTVSADEKLTVTKDQSTTVKGNETTSIDGSRSLTIKGKETSTISGGRTEKATKDRTIDVGGKRSLTVTGNATIASSNEFTREIVGKHTITGSSTWTTQCDGGLTTTTKGDGEETVALGRTSNGKNGVQTLVKGDFTDSIGAGHTVTAKGDAGETAKGKMKLTVAAALTATAPTIEISADSEITIACGGATVSIKSSGVEIKAPLLSVTGPLVILDGATVKHNP